ncbi:ParB/RepB/Spo0J family partition protein [Tautonia sp. JC769]|uniref:ParB/RepB/Spo0J family partition protein n=1 Tax=Tautonia sp. JC769 TaxID=3232135 RepID=UPI00345A33CA
MIELPPVTDVPTAKAHLDPNNFRKIYQLEGLISSIRDRGILQPIGLRADPERECFFAIWGNRRLAAAKELGLETVPARVFSEPLPPGEAECLQMVENLARSDLLPSEEANGYRQLIDRLGITAGDLATRLGISAGTVSKSLSLLKLARPLLEMVDRGQLAKTAGYELSHLPHEAQMELAENFGNSMTRDDVIRAVKNRPGRGKPKPAKLSLKFGEVSIGFAGNRLSLEELASLLASLAERARQAQGEGINLKQFAQELRSTARV